MDTLPPEILEQVFYNLDNKTCKILPQICKLFYEINKKTIFQDFLKQKLCKLNIDYNPVTCGGIYYYTLPNRLKHYLEISFYPNEQIAEMCCWNTGMKSGYEIGFYTNGQKWWERYWLDGKKHNMEIHYFQNETNTIEKYYPKYTVIWNNNEKHGLEQNWIKHNCLIPINCKKHNYYISETTEWKNNKEQQKIYYNCDGTIKTIKVYNNGELIDE